MIPVSKVSSFTIDHTKLLPGIYVARSARGVTTYDIRITAPNREPAIGQGEYHSLEHLCATFLRNSDVADDVVAFDGMACLTGFYLIMFDKQNGPYTPEEIRVLMLQCMDFVLSQIEVPATTPETCGNYHLHNLEIAKWWASEYIKRLSTDFHCEYTPLTVKLDNGMVFADS